VEAAKAEMRRVESECLYFIHGGLSKNLRSHAAPEAN
jgi:hypothetical protein